MESKNRKVLVNAFRCLIEFVKIYYEFLKEFYTLIWEATSSHIISQDRELAILAIEVWNTIANEDKERVGRNDVLKCISYTLMDLCRAELMPFKKKVWALQEKWKVCLCQLYFKIF